MTSTPSDIGTRATVRRWSTDVVPAHERMAFYADALMSGLNSQMRLHLESPAPSQFHSTMEVAELESFAIIRQHGSAHRVYRKKQGAARGSNRTFYLIVSLDAPWAIVHRGQARLAPGDGVFTDSALPSDLEFTRDYEVANLRFSEAWLRQWLPSPDMLVGQHIRASKGWGRALTAFASQLSPQIVHQSPLPIATVIDHVGSLLALVAAEAGPPPARNTRGEIDLRQRIKDLIAQRCTEAALTAGELAATLGISVRTLHRTLTRFNESFGNLLIAARAQTALRMLESPLLRRLTTAEIGFRAGFRDQSHFTRTMRARYGATPTQIRRASSLTTTP
ncbi:helix-turn-helix domain-containing protein [Variovorax sp. Sphag1AA]|uniref:helix-turn-helix domain-containing protein n=1 Tax=Variovorax sp. Sphag1AA TaxID=2587027 RepID=UPI0016119CED|nr:helix-turn-helix domain-containing protein [Variovorax sp. Sphag1AA]MBB3178138.1 AraC-like DNA-binding protein [Variovorax sp. Sphag1AA]